LQEFSIQRITAVAESNSEEDPLIGSQVLRQHLVINQWGLPLEKTHVACLTSGTKDDPQLLRILQKSAARQVSTTRLLGE